MPDYFPIQSSIPFQLPSLRDAMSLPGSPPQISLSTGKGAVEYRNDGHIYGHLGQTHRTFQGTEKGLQQAASFIGSNQTPRALVVQMISELTRPSSHDTTLYA